MGTFSLNYMLYSKYAQEVRDQPRKSKAPRTFELYRCPGRQLASDGRQRTHIRQRCQRSLHRTRPTCPKGHFVRPRFEPPKDRPIKGKSAAFGDTNPTW